MPLKTKKLSTIGMEVVGVSTQELLEEPQLPEEVTELLEANSVLLFRGLHLDDDEQVRFSKRLGQPMVRETPGWSVEHPGIYKIGLMAGGNSDVYVKGTFFWHMDGTINEIPPKASLLTARVLSGVGGNTSFASTYAAYERLSDDEKEHFATLKVWHSPEAATRRVEGERSPEFLERLRSEPVRLHPLVWTHHDGQKSLVLGETASHVEGMDEAEGAALLEELLERTTRPEYTYTHEWEVGDLVIWDNCGALHRVEPYDAASGRVMHRVTLEGDHPIE
jgi:alpha-ketoglutarate-dependent taurine dioxygenase